MTTELTGLRFLVYGNLDDCRHYLRHATREELIAAHRYCERNAAGNKTRKEMVASQLRRLEKQTPTPATR